MKRVIFTIVNNAYIKYAKTLKMSVEKQCPDYDFRIVLLEEDCAFHEDADYIILAKDIGVDDFYHRAFYYEITELATSIKPDAFMYFASRGYERIVYSDPDIFFYSPPLEIDAILNNHNIILTPHITEVMDSLDGKRPNELDLLRTGTYNLGFVAVRVNTESMSFLKWWALRLKYFAFESYISGQYTDQKWINIVGEIFAGVYILRHPGYNVAYWNLENRALMFNQEADAWMIGNNKLVFFHFSGFKETVKSISKNQNRASFESRPELIPLFEAYAESLSKNNEILEASYAYAKMSSGKSISSIQRIIYFHWYISYFYEVHINPFNISWENVKHLTNIYNSPAPLELHQSKAEVNIISKLRKTPKILRSILTSATLSGHQISRLISYIHLATDKSSYARIVSMYKRK